MNFTIHKRWLSCGAAALMIGVISMVLCWVNPAFGQNPRGTDYRLDPQIIREAVKKHITRYSPWDKDQMRIAKIKYNQSIKVPAGQLKLDVVAPKHTDWIGATAFTVNVLVNGQRAKRIIVPTKIEVWSDVVLAAKPLGKYQPIGIEDIHLKKMDMARVPANAITNRDHALGRRAKRNIAANSILRADQVEVPPIVKRGDIVQVVAQTPAMRIAVKGMVKQKGGIGDRIKVINLRSKKVIFAQVIDQQTVRVEF